MMPIAAVRLFALSLSEVAEQPHFHYTSFRVCGKIFVTIPPEETHIHVFRAGSGARGSLTRCIPEFAEKLCGQAVVGVRRSDQVSKPRSRATAIRRARRRGPENWLPGPMRAAIAFHDERPALRALILR